MIVDTSALIAILRAEPEAVRRILTNLIENAHKYGVGPVRVAVQVAVGHRAGSTGDERQHVGVERGAPALGVDDQHLVPTDGGQIGMPAGHRPAAQVGHLEDRQRLWPSGHPRPGAAAAGFGPGAGGRQGFGGDQHPGAGGGPGGGRPGGGSR